MKDDEWFLEIPIYRCSPEKFAKECEQEIQRHHQWLFKTSGAPKDKAPRVYGLAEKRIREEQGSWRYNQVAGWIRLLAKQSQVQAEYYFVDGTRLHKNVGSKILVYQGKVFELSFNPEQSSKEIFQTLSNALSQLQKEAPFKNRFIDSELFLNIGKYINWCELIGL
jgi:hypothetical protein